MAMSLLVIPYSCSNVSPLTEVRKQQRQRVEHCPPTLSSFHLDCNARHCPSGHVVACISSSSSSHSNVSSPTKLYISGLSFQTTEETLRNAFVQFVEEDKYRSFIYGEGEKNTTWIHGAPPNFDVVDKLFEEGRTQEWPLGSLEEKVQRLVKTMEMELFHKANPKDYKAIDPSRFTFAVNGRKGLTMAELRQLGGGYNGFLQTSLPEELRLYDYTKETMESSHKLFTTTFPRGFAFEILKAYSGPPVIAYKFRHWAWMEGPFKGYPPTGELVELFGIGIFEVDEQMRVIKVEFFYDSGELLGALMKGGKGVSSSSDDTKMGCPFLGNTAPKY